MQAAEEATGKTAQQIYKMMENGELLAKDFLVPFAGAMRRIVRENKALEKATQKLTSQQHRLNTAYKVMVNDVFQKGGAAKLFGDIFQELASLIESITPMVTMAFSELNFKLNLVWDVLSSVVGLMGDLINLGSRLGSQAREWSWIQKVFYGIQVAIYGTLEAFEELRNMIRGGLDTDFKKLAMTIGKLTPAGFLANSAYNLTTAESAKAGSTSVGTVIINSNATNSKDVARDVMDQWNIQLGM